MASNKKGPEKGPFLQTLNVKLAAEAVRQGSARILAAGNTTRAIAIADAF